MFKKLAVDPDLEWEFIDEIMKAHLHSSSTAYGQKSAIGKSVAGNTTKIYIGVGFYSLPIHFRITGGEVRRLQEMPKLITEWPNADYMLPNLNISELLLHDTIN